MPFILSIIISYIMIALAMAFYTLVERKLLGYFQLRKGPNKVSLIGLPQPFADALKLFTKELNIPSFANSTPFLVAPVLSLTLALSLWHLYPHTYMTFFFSFGFLFFLMISSITVYATLAAGWASNSKYALLGAIRGIAQTISYEVSMILILLSPIIIMATLNLSLMMSAHAIPLILLLMPSLIIWFITALAETNRAPFDFAEGESELVSGFNTEYSSGTFALIFMAEYMNILFMSLITSVIFLPTNNPMLLAFFSLMFSYIFVWVRGTLPRMRYDQLMALTWKSFLPYSLAILVATISLIFLLTALPL
uniref:NADH-ubiquinone oxidoreductase chain 1 n=1 Tax=Phascolosoma pacificum TaxID=1634976 RepID=A0A1D8BES6_9ANNE|nr:NADH dehydrogenase subunit 1 [Phascolosoma pacificum]AOS53045.1 NADH dehydrogenase subunit 1 [Phascolosoma pacificum]